MLLEILTSWRTDCPPPLARLGYRYAAVACAARARRCAAAWAPHQQRTRTAILRAAADADPAGTALVLGSGPCLDVPVAELAARFRRVILADAAQLPAARALARRHPAVELATLDLTGMAAGLARGGPPPAPGCTAFLGDAGIRLVVSANLLSQLPLLPLAALARRLPDQELERMGRRIVEAHLAHLRGFAAPVLLVSDIERSRLAADGTALTREDPVFGASLPPGEEWDWVLAPAGELPGGQQLRTRVRAVRLDRSAPAPA